MKIILLLFSALFFREALAQTKFIRVFVALCDNKTQGIVPVPQKTGNGNDPANNLYWGCTYGMKTYFKNSSEWQLVSSVRNLDTVIMERYVFRHREKDAVMIADAYRGSNMRECLADFFSHPLRKRYRHTESGRKNFCARCSRCRGFYRA